MLVQEGQCPCRGTADSALDTENNSALGLLDNNYASYVQRDDWDYGGAYPGHNKGMTVELDDVYDLGMIAFAEPLDLGAYMYVNVQYWDESGTRQTAANVTMLKKEPTTETITSLNSRSRSAPPRYSWASAGTMADFARLRYRSCAFMNTTAWNRIL